MRFTVRCEGSKGNRTKARPLISHISEAVMDSLHSSDRRLLIAVRHWLLANGWTRTWRGWTDPDNTVSVDTCGDYPQLHVWHREQDGWPRRCRDYPVRSVREAVDILASVGVMPAQMHSAFTAGAAAMVEPRREAVAA